MLGNYGSDSSPLMHSSKLSHRGVPGLVSRAQYIPVYFTRGDETGKEMQTDVAIQQNKIQASRFEVASSMCGSFPDVR